MDCALGDQIWRDHSYGDLTSVITEKFELESGLFGTTPYDDGHPLTSKSPQSVHWSSYAHGMNQPAGQSFCVKTNHYISSIQQMNAEDIEKMPSTSRKWCPSAAVRRAMINGAHSAHVRKRITSSAVIEVLKDEPPQAMLDGRVEESSETGADHSLRSVSLRDEDLPVQDPHPSSDAPIETDAGNVENDGAKICVMEKIDGETNNQIRSIHLRPIDDSSWDSSTFWQPASITTVDVPITKLHTHPLGLAQVVFDNCVVKVHAGQDLDNLLSLSRRGKVQLTNVTSYGWSATDRTHLPCCIFARWISNMKAAG
jgi:hypothetical protein